MSLVNRMLTELDARRGGAAPAHDVLHGIEPAAGLAERRRRPPLVAAAATLALAAAWALGPGLPVIAGPRGDAPAEPPAAETSAAADHAPRAAPQDAAAAAPAAGRPRAAGGDPDADDGATFDASLARLAAVPEPALGGPSARPDAMPSMASPPAVGPGVGEVTMMTAPWAQRGEQVSQSDGPAPRPAPPRIRRPATVAPPDAPALLREARTALAAGDATRAAVLARRALAAAPRSVGARTLLAALAVAAGDRPRAAAVLDEGLALTPGEPALVTARARLLVEDGDVPAAARLLRTAAAQGADDARYLALAAAVAQRLGRHDEAIAAWRRALGMAPGNGAWAAGMAISLAAEGHHDEARRWFRRALRDPSLPAAVRRFVTARLERASGRRG